MGVIFHLEVSSNNFGEPGASIPSLWVQIESFKNWGEYFDLLSLQKEKSRDWGEICPKFSTIFWEIDAPAENKCFMGVDTSLTTPIHRTKITLSRFGAVRYFSLKFIFFTLLSSFFKIKSFIIDC